MFSIKIEKGSILFSAHVTSIFLHFNIFIVSDETENLTVGTRDMNANLNIMIRLKPGCINLFLWLATYPAVDVGNWVRQNYPKKLSAILYLIVS